METDSTSSRFARLSEGTLALWLLVAAGVLWASPSLGLGLLVDDRAHKEFVELHSARAMIDGDAMDMFVVGRAPTDDDLLLQAYLGKLPWWTSEGFSVSFFRPLAVLTHYVDYGVWPYAPWLMHLHNLLWYGGLLLVVGLLYRQLLGAGTVASLGLLLYAIDEAHVEGAAWLAGRNTLMTAFFLALALLLHVRSRQQDDGSEEQAPALLMPAFLLFLAFASSEGAVTIWAYLLPYALLLDRGGVKRRLSPLLPMAAVTVGWQLLYNGLGFGARNSGMYFHPGQDLVGFAAAVVERYPAGLRHQFGLTQPDGAWADGLTLLGLLLCSALALWMSRDRRRTAFFLGSTLLAAVPLCSVITGPRLLLPVSIGACALLAEMLSLGMHHLRRGTGVGRPAGALLAGAVVTLHLVAPAVLAPLVCPTLAAVDAHIARGADSLPWEDEVMGASLAIVNAPNLFRTTLELQERTLREGAAAANTYVLGTTTRPVSLERPSADVIVLRPEGGYLDDPWSRMVRRRGHGFEKGYTMRLAGLFVEVLEVTEDGRPAAVQFGLDPGTGEVVWANWNGKAGRYERLTLPPVGERITLH